MVNIAVTVILPSLNVAGYIEKCLKSVINQKLLNIEIICIDAGSTDGTLDILERYSKRDERISIVHSEVKSYGYQVNLGIQLAKGEYIAIVETDDYVSTDFLGKLYENAKVNDLDVSKTDAYFHFSNDSGDYLSESHINSRFNIEYNRIYRYSEIPKFVLFDSSIWNGIYRKKFLTENGIELNCSKGAAYQDIGFLVQLLFASPKIMYSSDSLYFYRYAREGSSSVNSNVLYFVKQEWLFLEERGFLNRGDLTSAYAISKLILCFAYEYNKLLAHSDFNEKEECICNCLEWFKQAITDALNSSPLISRILNIESVNEIFSEEYLTTRREMQKRYKRNLEEYRVALSSKSVIIFGCGSYGKKVCDILTGWGISPLFFCDNNSTVWGSRVKDIEVKEPEKVLCDYSGIIVIANKKNFAEIEKQVREISKGNPRIIDAREMFEPDYCNLKRILVNS